MYLLIKRNLIFNNLQIFKNRFFLMNNIIDLDEIQKQVNEINNFFSSDLIEQIALETGFVKRQSKLTGTIFLSIFILGLNMYQKPTLQQFISLLNTLIPDFEISREGFSQRINDLAVKFFEFMLSKVVNMSVSQIDLNILKHFKRFLIVDSTIITLPEELENLFKGHGGDSSKSGIKIQFCYDLKSSEFSYIIQPAVSSDNKYGNTIVDIINQSDLIIQDLGGC